MLQSPSPDEIQRIKGLVELREQGCNLMDVQHGSIRLYFWCLDESSVCVLKEWVETGRLNTVVEELFASLLTANCSQNSLRLSYDRGQFDNAMRFFTDRRRNGGNY